MKKQMILFSLLSALFLSACAKDLPLNEQTELSVSEGIAMSVDEETITPVGASFLLLQNTDLRIIYGDDYKLQRCTDSIWTDVDTIVENYAFHTIAYELPKETPETVEIDWEWLYGSLPAGEYRLVKTFMDFRGTGDYDHYESAASFMIK